jgi:CAAX protease family protein
MERRLWPYLAPYGVLVGLAQLGSWLPSLEAPLLAARVALPALLLGEAWRRGAYAELRGSAATLGLSDVAFGVAIAVLWVAPYLLFAGLPRGEAFDPDTLGPDRRALWIALRVVGFVLVSPLVEELFVRSFLHRAAEGWPDWREFARFRIGRFQQRAFTVTVLWFTASHLPWEWWVAAPTGALFNLWLYRRGRLANVWLAHAITNGVIAAAVLLGPVELAPFL